MASGGRSDRGNNSPDALFTDGFPKCVKNLFVIMSGCGFRISLGLLLGAIEDIGFRRFYAQAWI